MLSTREPSSISEKKQADAAYQTGFVRWRATEQAFRDWSLHGVTLTPDGLLELDPARAVPGTDPYAPGTYSGGNYYNGGSFLVGEVTSPEIPTSFPFRDAISSWNASTPSGSWLEVQIRACYGERWSKWYVLGIWASDGSTIRRHSVGSQGDSDGSVSADTFISSNKEESASVLQVRLRLFSTDGAACPTVRNLSVAYSGAAPKTAEVSAGNPALWDKRIEVPKYSQMIYPNGGNVWCSPTSTAMVLAYWDKYDGDCAPRVHAAVESVYDWVYDGHGNWPFNTAYAATQGYEGYVARLSSLRKLEVFVAAGIPVIMSIAWGKGELTNSDVDSSNGHLMVLVGFDSLGNPILNDPAAPDNERVRRTYLRSEFEPLWLRSSGGTVYLIYPEGMPIPDLP
jgi:hypothetical protein